MPSTVPAPPRPGDPGGPGRASVVRLWSLVAVFALVTLVRSGAGRHPVARPARRDPRRPAPADRRHLRGPGRGGRGAPYAGRPAHPAKRACADPPAPVGRPASRPGRGGARRLPRRLLLLPQPEELGRPEPAPRHDAARLGPLVVPRAQPRRAAAPPARSGSGRLRPGRCLRVVLDAGVRLLRRRGRAARPHPRRLRVHRLDGVRVDPRCRVVLRDPVPGSLPLGPSRVRGAAAHDGAGHPVAVPRASGPGCWPIRRPTAPSPRCRRSPACTWASRP